ncbi:hypothetical protein [uncultured Stenotrophomonas sp.]|uniref:hypothetical protein n=1 Tax=uncultured Stenotrophomonas sp. TaxID=165438 RepID=UPI0025864664|nr:hypothetical protein [uncultured Stenotrophomonas sp.]
MYASKLLQIVTLSIALSGCMEVASTEYADRNQVVSRQAIGESKWLPSWLPEDAVNIRESHDIDTNESWLVFRLTSGVLTLPEECRLVSRPEMSDARVMRRFPPFARNAWSRASSYGGKFYLCPEGNAGRWVMRDEELGLVYSGIKL